MILLPIYCVFALRDVRCGRLISRCVLCNRSGTVLAARIVLDVVANVSERTVWSEIRFTEENWVIEFLWSELRVSLICTSKQLICAAFEGLNCSTPSWRYIAQDQHHRLPENRCCDGCAELRIGTRKHAISIVPGSGTRLISVLKELSRTRK